MLNKSLPLLLPAILLLTAGCSTNPDDAGLADLADTAAPGGDDAALTREIDAREARIQALEEQLSNRESRIVALESSLDDARTVAAAEAAQTAAGDGTLFPPNAKPGECYARVLFPERFRTV